MKISITFWTLSGNLLLTPHNMEYKNIYGLSCCVQVALNSKFGEETWKDMPRRVCRIIQPGGKTGTDPPKTFDYTYF